MDARLRPAVPADRPSLEIIRQQAVEAAYEDRYDQQTVAEWVTTPDVALASRIEDDQSVAVVAETAVTQVGFAVADVESGRLVAIYVSPDYERRGHGTALLEAVAERLREAGVETMTVDAPEAVAPFFRQHGFDPADPAPDAPVPAVRMSKPLDP